MPTLQELKEQAFIKKINCLGFSYLFEKRSARYSRLINLLKVFGIIVPASIGAVALSYGYSTLKPFITIAIPITIVQFIFSVLAIVFKWDDELSYSFEAYQAHVSLYTKYVSLIANVNSNSTVDFNLLEVEYIQRTNQDSKHSITEWELRRCMRYSLRQHQKECTGCRQVPNSMESTNCDVCGKFSFKYNKVIL